MVPVLARCAGTVLAGVLGFVGDGGGHSRPHLAWGAGGTGERQCAEHGQVVLGGDLCCAHLFVQHLGQHGTVLGGHDATTAGLRRWPVMLTMLDVPSPGSTDPPRGPPVGVTCEDIGTVPVVLALRRTPQVNRRVVLREVPTLRSDFCTDLGL